MLSVLNLRRTKESAESNHTLHAKRISNKHAKIVFEDALEEDQDDIYYSKDMVEED